MFSNSFWNKFVIQSNMIWIVECGSPLTKNKSDNNHNWQEKWNLYKNIYVYEQFNNVDESENINFAIIYFFILTLSYAILIVESWHNRIFHKYKIGQHNKLFDWRIQEKHSWFDI